MRQHLLPFCTSLFLLLSPIAKADVLVEYLFWDSMGSQVAKGVQSYQQYQAERQLWRDNIAAARREMAACGDCPAAKAKLDHWQGIQNQFQDVAGGLAASVGMPRALARALDIDMPLAPPPNLAEVTIATPDWIEDRTPECQSAVQEHLACLRDFQSRRQRQGLRTTSLTAARVLGAACYQSARLYRQCAAKDYDAFRQETEIIRRRQEGAVIPQVHGDGAYVDVYYGRVPENFTLELPPADVILKKMSDATLQIRFFSRTDAADVLDQATIFGAFHNILAPDNRCFDGERERPELERRICEDLSMISWHVLRDGQRYSVLQCDYTKPGGSFRVGASLRDIARDSRTRWYWYGERPEMAHPQRLMQRSASHPLLSVGAPRTQCPPTLAAAERADRADAAERAALRVSQISASIVIPVPEILRKRREEYERRRMELKRQIDLTEKLQLEGFYRLSLQTSSDQPSLVWAEGRHVFEPFEAGQEIRAHCLLGRVAPKKYFVLCKLPEGKRSARGTFSTYGGMGVRWFDDWTSYVVETEQSRTLVAFANDEVVSSTLTQIRPLTPLATLPLVGRYRLDMVRNGDGLSLPCTMEPRKGHRDAFKVSCAKPSGETLEFAIHPNVGSQTVFNTAGWGRGLMPELDGKALPRSYWVTVDEFQREIDPEAVTLIFHDRANPDVEWRLHKTGPLPGMPDQPPQASRSNAPACTISKVAGRYRSHYGTIDCKAAGDALDCCYGKGSCEKRLHLSLSGARQVSGGWDDGSATGAAAFSLDGQCRLGDGRWGMSANALRSRWPVRERIE